MIINGEKMKKNYSASNSWEMFNQIAYNYDFLNKILSFGIDGYWRKKLIAELPDDKPIILADISTGTADILIATEGHPFLQIEEMIGIDPSAKMIAIGQKKIIDKKLYSKTSFYISKAEELSKLKLKKKVDAVTISFGIRNMEDPEKGLQEIYKILKPGGKILILEFSIPSGIFFRQIYLFYFRYLLPIIGGIFSKNFKAYRYLNKSVENFPCGKEFVQLLEKNNYLMAKAVPLSFGIVNIYTGLKKKK